MPLTRAGHAKIIAAIRSNTYLEHVRNMLGSLYPVGAISGQLNQQSNQLQVITQGAVFSGFFGAIWLVGALGFSVLWVVLLTAVLAFREIQKNQRKHKIEVHRLEDALIQAQAFDEAAQKPLQTKQGVKLADDDFALLGMDLERAEWLNSMLKDMWPYIGKYIKEILETSIEPMVREMEPSQVLGGFKFTNVHMGTISPRVNSITAYRPKKVKDVKTITLDMEISFCSNDMKIEFTTMGMTMGVEDVIFKGHCRVEMSPLIPSVPFFGSLSLAFTESPKIDFDLTGLANLVEIPGLNPILHSTIDDVFSSMFVLPAKMTIPMIPPDQMGQYQLTPYDIMHPFAKGCLYVHVIQAESLIAKDNVKLAGIKLKKGSSDPFIEMTVGNQKKSTAIINKQLCPTWNEKFCFLINNPALQRISFQVYDSDDDKPLNNDPDKLGHFELPIQSITSSEGGKIVGKAFDLNEVESGRVFVDLYWLPLEETSADENTVKPCKDTWTSVVVEHVSEVPKIIVKKFQYCYVAVDTNNLTSKPNKKYKHTRTMGTLEDMHFEDEMYFKEATQMDVSKVQRTVLLKSSENEIIAQGKLEYDASDYTTYTSEYKILKLNYLEPKYKQHIQPEVKLAIRIQRAVGSVHYRKIGSTKDALSSAKRHPQLSAVARSDIASLSPHPTPRHFLPEGDNSPGVIQAGLSILLKRGHNLVAKDNINLGFKKLTGKSDPYVKVSFGERSVKTKVIQKSLDPVWNEELQLAIPQPPPEDINIEVFDHDGIGGDDSLGTLSVDFGEVVNSKNGIYRSERARLAGVEHGEISFEIRYLQGNDIDQSESETGVDVNNNQPEKNQPEVVEISLFSSTPQPKQSPDGAGEPTIDQEYYSPVDQTIESPEVRPKQQISPPSRADSYRQKVQSSVSTPSIVINNETFDVSGIDDSILEESQEDRDRSASAVEFGEDSLGFGLRQRVSHDSSPAKSSKRGFFKRLNPFSSSRSKSSQHSLLNESVYNAESVVSIDKSMNDMNTSRQSQMSDTSNMSMRYPEKVMVELTLRLTAIGNCILSCTVHQLSYPASESFKRNQPNPQYYVQVQLMGDINTKKKNKQKTQPRLYVDNEPTAYHEKFEFICNKGGKGKNGSNVDLDKTWVRIAIKDASIGGSRMSLIGGDKTIAHGKISLRTIYDKAYDRDYNAWYRLYST